MGKNYDNWERLVRAVARRERDKQLAWTHSRSTSSSSQLSSSSTSRSLLQLPMDFSDLTLDHKDWKAMLPPVKREVVWRSSSLSFFLDGRTGNNCFLLGATNLTMGSGDGASDCWKNKFHPQSRFLEATELIDSRHLYIEGDDYPDEQAKMVKFQEGDGREDGWMEIQVGKCS